MTALKTGKVSLLLVVFHLIAMIDIKMSSCSSIPIWELLTRNEKMSYLYPTFAQLVSDHCKAIVVHSNAQPVNHCKRDLLNYGYERMQSFSEAELDTFDPYQRDSNELIWATIMRNHPSASLLATTRSPSTLLLATTNIQQLPRQNGVQSNPMFAQSAEYHNHKYAMDMDAVADATGRQTSDRTEGKEHRTYLSGPLVVRVRPDGTPIDEYKQLSMPRDDDDVELSEYYQWRAAVRHPMQNSRSYRRIAGHMPRERNFIATLARRIPISSSALNA